MTGLRKTHVVWDVQRNRDISKPLSVLDAQKLCNRLNDNAMNNGKKPHYKIRENKIIEGGING